MPHLFERDVEAEDADSEEEIMNVERKISEFHRYRFIVSLSSASHVVTQMSYTAERAARFLVPNSVHGPQSIVKQSHRCIHVYIHL